MHPDSIHIDYGRGAVPVRIDPARARWHIVQPRHVPPLDHPREHFRTACANPLASPPLAEIIAPTDRIVITTSDGTRPVPNRALLPWLLEILPVAAEHITLVVGAGTHRPNTAEELEHMLGPAVLRRIRVVNHDAYDPGMNVRVGETAAGLPGLLNRHYVEADNRIALGFIEPHFFAGFSGGPKRSPQVWLPSTPSWGFTATASSRTPKAPGACWTAIRCNRPCGTPPRAVRRIS